MKLSKFLTDIANSAGSYRKSNDALLKASLEQLKKQLQERNTCGQSCLPKFLQNTETLPNLYQIEIEIRHETDAKIIGVFTLRSTVTEADDEVDFSAFLDHDNNGDERVVIHMPHWSFPRYATTKSDRMELIAFLEEEAKERTGFDASLILLPRPTSHR